MLFKELERGTSRSLESVMSRPLDNSNADCDVCSAGWVDMTSTAWQLFEPFAEQVQQQLQQVLVVGSGGAGCFRIDLVLLCKSNEKKQ